MSIDKEKFFQSMIKYLGIDKENNSDEIKLNDLDTDREYQVKLAKELWNDKISIEDKFWYPEDYYYIEDFIIEERGFKKIGFIKFGNIEKDKFLYKDNAYGDWKKEFKIYFNESNNRILVFVNYIRFNDAIWNLPDLEHFIGIYKFNN